MAWNDLGVVSPGPRGGQEGKGSGRVGRGSGASCLQPALGGGPGWTLRHHEGILSLCGWRHGAAGGA